MVKSKRAGVDAPTPYFVDIEHNCIYMEYVAGRTVKSLLCDVEILRDPSKAFLIAEEIGRAIARLHQVDIVHGDLTTSNILVRDGASIPVLFTRSTSIDTYLVH